MASKSLIGTQFRAPWGELNLLWEVKARRGTRFDCLVLDDEDMKGRWRVFTGAEIRRAQAHKVMVDASFQQSEDFYASLKPGQLVHWHNVGDKFMRYEVVVHEGANVLKAIALVGDAWSSYDLGPGYYATLVRDGGFGRPHAGSFYETFPAEQKARFQDPTSLAPRTLLG